MVMMASDLQANCAGDMEWSRQKCVKMVWMLAIREGTVHKCVPFFTVFTLLGTIKYGNIYKKRGYCDNSLTHRLF